MSMLNVSSSAVFVSLGPARDVIFLIGRILVAVVFLMSSMNHLFKLSMMSGYAKSKGVPLPSLAVAGSGILILLGALSILLGFHPTIGALLLAIFLLGVTFGMHNFWAIQDPQAKQAEMINFLKNTALLGFVLMTLLIPRPWPFSIGH
jgi:putative oxidoreductase